MKNKPMFFFAFLFCAISAVFAVSVSDLRGFYAINSAGGVQPVTVETEHHLSYPTNTAGLPQFWFDCSDTNDWEITEADGIIQVSKIPSLVGERYLTAVKETPYSWWWDDLKKPELVTDDELTGPVLDFGVKGSLRCMAFNAFLAEGASVASNELANIGTVIAVYFTDWGDGIKGEGGYYGGGLLGGGYGYNGLGFWKGGYLCYRSHDDVRTLVPESGPRYRWIDNPMVNSSHTHKSWISGTFWHNGFASSPYTGFGSGWATVTLMPGNVATYGLAVATGLGMNYTAVSAVSGGFKVAEMMIFDHVIADEDRALIEAYLARKWFKDEKRARRGSDGNASMGWVRVIKNASGEQDGWDQPFEVAAGEKLTVGRLQGSRSTTTKLSGIVKTGEGTLELGEADKFAGPVKVAGGTLEFTRRDIPDKVPGRPRLHIDASDADSLVCDESGAVAVWRDLSGDTYKDNAMCLRPNSETGRPTVFADALGDGLSVVDFGDYSSTPLCHLRTATNETENLSGVSFTLRSVTTVIALVGAQNGGGELAGLSTGSTHFSRVAAYPLSYTSAFLNPNLVVLGVPQKKCSIWIDGIPVDGSAGGYLTPGYQVVAIQSPGTDLNVVGAAFDGSGGLRIGEFVAYTTQLTEREILDATAYLMRKWLNREAPGYDRFKSGGTPDLQRVELHSQSDIRVEGGVARIGELVSGNGTKVVKTGSGTLEVQRAEVKEIEVLDGNVAFSAPPDVSSVSELAANPSLHLDASDASTFELYDINGTNVIERWYSVHDRGILGHSPFPSGAVDFNVAAKESYRKQSPYIDEEVTLNGKPVVDFGPYTTAAGGRFLQLSRSFDSVRSAYIVWAPRDDTRGTYFGNAYGTLGGGLSGEFYDYLRSENHTNNCPLIYANNTANSARYGELYTNGVKSSYAAVPAAGQFMLLESHPRGATHVSALGVDRNVNRLAGGIRVAEVVLYERTLTEREKIATRNYLMAKWFGAEPQALPAAEDSPAELYSVNVGGRGTSTKIRVDESVKMCNVVGEGTLDVSGSGTLTVDDCSSFSGTVSVASGTTLKLGGMRVYGGEMVTDGLIYWADAGYGATVVTNDAGEVEITEWKSRLDDGWTARPLFEANRPTLIADGGLGGRTVVDLKFADNEGMLFFKDGQTNILDNIRSVVWLLGSQEGGSYLLGGGTNWNSAAAYYNFMRGRSDTTLYYYQACDTLLNGVEYWTVQDELFDADWFINGETVLPTEASLSGEWDLISMKLQPDAPHPTNADGFAFDGRALRGTAGYVNWTGGQRLAEVLIYDRVISEDERSAVEAYLRRKWGYLGAQSDPVNSAVLNAEEGAVVDLGGTNQYFAAVTGTGTFVNGSLSVGTFTADTALSIADLPVVEGKVRLEPGQKVEVRGLASLGENLRIPLMSCTGLEAVEYSRDPTVTGTAEDLAVLERYRARIVFENGVMYFKLVPYGTVIVVR